MLPGDRAVLNIGRPILVWKSWRVDFALCFTVYDRSIGAWNADQWSQWIATLYSTWLPTLLSLRWDLKCLSTPCSLLDVLYWNSSTMPTRPTSRPIVTLGTYCADGEAGVEVAHRTLWYDQWLGRTSWWCMPPPPPRLPTFVIITRVTL
jgi:hypothetical protein